MPWPSNPHGSVRERERERDQQLGTTRGGGGAWAGTGKVSRCAHARFGPRWVAEPPLQPCLLPLHPAILILKARCLVLSCPSTNITTHVSILRSTSHSAYLIFVQLANQIPCPEFSILPLAIILPPPSARQQASNIVLSRPRRSRPHVPHVQQTAECPVCQPTHFCHSQPET